MAAGVSGLVLIADTLTIARPRDRLYPERRSVPAGVTLRDAIRFAPQALPKPRWLLDFVRAGIQMPPVAMGLRPDGTPMGLFEGIEKIDQQTPAWETFPGSVGIESPRARVDAELRCTESSMPSVGGYASV